MLCLKKIYRDELVQLALILSLLRVNPDSYLGYDVSQIGVGDLVNGTSWAHVHAETLIQRRLYVHPKSLDSVLLNDEQQVFDDLNALGRYNRINSHAHNVTAYLLNIDDVHTTNNNTAVLGTTSQVIRPTIGGNNANDIDGSTSPASTSSENGGTPFSFDDVIHAGDEEETRAPQGADLTQEDMDLIEVLWKQDVDLGFSLELFNAGKQDGREKVLEEEDMEKLKALEAIKNDSNTLNNLKIEDEEASSSSSDDPWAGLAYTVDLETGEYVLKGGAGISDELTDADTCLTDDEPPSLIGLPDFSLEEALQLVGLDEVSQELKTEIKVEEDDLCASGVTKELDDRLDLSDDPDSEFGLLEEMIQTAQFHHPHARSFQGRMPYARTMSMEQRWQDLANLLSLPGPPGDASGMPHPFAHHHHHHHHHNYSGPHGAYSPDTRGVLLHNATLAPPMGDLNATSPYTMSSAVATSMNLTNSSEPMGDPGPHGSYKMEGPHDMMYYQNSTPEINQTTEGFLSSILNDEDLQLMDMAMNEGMYTMRMLDSNASNNATSIVGTPTEERMDASSDSAVSSMGSERVPSLSDGEWMETGSDSGHMPTDSNYTMDYHAGKYRPYDYSYSGRKHSGAPVGPSDSSHRMPPMAQKKHQMFGKRYFQGSDGSSLGSHGIAASLPPTSIKYEYSEAGAASIAPSLAFSSPVEGAVGPKPPEMKYSCSMDFIRHHPDPRPSMEQVQHNHSYHLPPESSNAMHRPFARDKQKGRKTTEEEHLNRDEKRARVMNIPMTVGDIINLPMDEFNERLSKYDLSEAQLSLIRDIRRRGKNKVAAQNCRKRKLDQILTLADEVKDMRDRKTRIIRERDFMLAERQRVKEKFSQLYRHVFQALRDHEGNPYSSYEYSLQQSADGTVLLVPRTNATSMLEQPDLSRHKHKDHEQHHRKE